MCDRAYLKDLTQTVFIVGVMISAMTYTSLADKFGRKPIFLFSQWAMVVVGVANAFAPNYYVFVILRLFTGIAFQVYCYTLCNSIVGFFLPKTMSTSTKMLRHRKM